MEQVWKEYMLLELNYIGRIVLAGLCGYAIGFERQTKRKMAGRKTHVIVAITAALMIILSQYGFYDVLEDSIKLDPSRVAAGIVTAISFLGSGMIFSRNFIIVSELFIGRKSNVNETVEIERQIEIEYIEKPEGEINISAILQSGFDENGFQVEKDAAKCTLLEVAEKREEYTTHTLFYVNSSNAICFVFKKTFK